jgi:Flp pilus assembly protein TadG
MPSRAASTASIGHVWRRFRRNGRGSAAVEFALARSDEIIVADMASGATLRVGRRIAATEFAFIMPIMLVLFFGTVEFSSGIAVDRKVTLMARTLTDLTSRSVSVANSDWTNFFTPATES